MTASNCLFCKCNFPPLKTKWDIRPNQDVVLPTIRTIVGTTLRTIVGNIVSRVTRGDERFVDIIKNLILQFVFIY